jgi:hypothetical protein
MTKNNSIGCPPGQCELQKVSKEIQDTLFKHFIRQFKPHLADLQKEFPTVHKGCMQKMYAEALQETGSYLLGELYVKNFAPEIAKEVQHD